MQKDFPQKIIFLDFDGCVTSIVDNTYFNPNPELYHASKKIVDRLKRFCIDNNVKIVISSNWRKFAIDGVWKTSGHEYKNPLPNFIKELGDLYFDSLPPIRHTNKSTVLIKWLDDTKFNGKFVIFDDDLNEQYQYIDKYNINKNFIFIDSQLGITNQNLKTAKEILNEK